MRRFFAPDIGENQESIALDAAETRHLRDVLRLREGAAVNLFDGRGREFSAIVSSFDRKTAVLTEIREIDPASPESNLDLTLGQALLKGEKFDFVVQKCVELGVRRLVPLVTARSEARHRDVGARLERWKRIALDATKQCGRALLMEIEMPLEFHDFVTSTNGAIMFCEQRGGALSRGKSNELTAIVGPEGGWANDEMAFAAEHGVQLVTLGGRILRAETAAIAITAIIQHRWGDVN